MKPAWAVFESTIISGFERGRCYLHRGCEECVDFVDTEGHQMYVAAKRVFESLESARNEILKMHLID